MSKKTWTLAVPHEVVDGFLADQPSFDNIRTGDRVWSAYDGWGTVEEMDGNDQTFLVRFEEHAHAFWFNSRAECEGISTGRRSLYWGIPTVKFPPPPARKGRRQARVNIDQDGFASLYPSQEEADTGAHSDRVACVPVTYEVEE